MALCSVHMLWSPTLNELTNGMGWRAGGAAYIAVTTIRSSPEVEKSSLGAAAGSERFLDQNRHKYRTPRLALPELQQLSCLSIYFTMLQGLADADRQ